MKTEMFVEPETSEEMELIELLSEARKQGLEEVGLSDEEMASLFSQFAVGTLLGSTPDDTSDRYDCPNCGQPIEDVQAKGLGEPPTALPCECELEYKDVPEELYLDNSNPR